MKAASSTASSKRTSASSMTFTSRNWWCASGRWRKTPRWCCYPIGSRNEPNHYNPSPRPLSWFVFRANNSLMMGSSRPAWMPDKRRAPSRLLSVISTGQARSSRPASAGNSPHARTRLLISSHKIYKTPCCRSWGAVRCIFTFRHFFLLFPMQLVEFI